MRSGTEWTASSFNRPRVTLTFKGCSKNKPRSAARGFRWPRVRPPFTWLLRQVRLVQEPVLESLSRSNHFPTLRRLCNLTKKNLRIRRSRKIDDYLNKVLAKRKNKQTNNKPFAFLYYIYHYMNLISCDHVFLSRSFEEKKMPSPSLFTHKKTWSYSSY